MARLKDVAEAAGVSPITVSRVMRGEPNVLPETRDRVLAAAHDLHYVPNAVARSLKQARSKLVGLVMTDMGIPFFDRVARGAEAAARRHGMTVVLGNTADDPELEAGYLRTMSEHRVDGIVLVPTPSTVAVARPSVPLVVLDRALDDQPVDVVRCDARGGTAELIRHLVAYGHRQIALVGGMDYSHTWRERVAGYREAMAATGLGPACDLVFPADYRAAGGARITRNLMRGEPLPDAIVAANAHVVQGVLDTLAELHLSVPGDVSVCCVDDPALPTRYRPALTVVEQPGHAMGEAAIELIVARIGNGGLAGPPVERVFPALLRVGESCREGLLQPVPKV